MKIMLSLVCEGKLDGSFPNTSGLITDFIIPVADLESVKCWIFSLIRVILLLKMFI